MTFGDLSYLVALVLIGYLFSSRLDKQRLRFRSMSNYAIFCESAIAGVVIFAVTWILLVIYKHTVLSCSIEDQFAQEACFFEEYYPSPLIDSIVLAALFAYFGPWWINRFGDLETALEKVARESGQIPNLILDSLKELKPIEISTVGRKVYVGLVRSRSGVSLSGEIVDLAIVPFYSGYRNEADLTRILTTNYGPIIQEKSNTLSHDQYHAFLHEISVVIPLSEIVSFRQFSNDIQSQFNHQLETNISI